MKRLVALGIIGMLLIFLVQLPAGVAGNGYMGGARCDRGGRSARRGGR